jgi:hypothetical protein
MKITKRQLSRIIKEEKGKLHEVTRDEGFRRDVLERLDDIIYELDDDGYQEGSLIDSVKQLRKDLDDRLPGRYPRVSMDDPVWD